MKASVSPRKRKVSLKRGCVKSSRKYLAELCSARLFYSKEVTKLLYIQRKQNDVPLKKSVRSQVLFVLKLFVAVQTKPTEILSRISFFFLSFSFFFSFCLVKQTFICLWRHTVSFHSHGNTSFDLWCTQMLKCTVHINNFSAFLCFFNELFC